MDNIEKALKILAMSELPENAREQIDALFEASSEKEKNLFAIIYEGYFPPSGENNN